MTRRSQLDIDLGPLSSPGDTLAAGSLEPAQDASTPLRTPSHLPTPSYETTIPALPVHTTPSAIRGILHEFERLSAECWWAIGKLKTDIESGDQKRGYTPLANLIGHARSLKLAELRARLAARGEMRGQPTEWIELQQRVLDALEPYPDAKEAVLRAIEGE